MMQIFLLLLIFCPIKCSALLRCNKYFDLVKIFITEQHLSYVYILNCNIFCTDRVKLVNVLGEDRYSRLFEYSFKDNSNYSLEKILAKINRDNRLLGNKGFLLDGDCESSRDFLIKAGEFELFSDSYYWLIITKKFVKNVFSKLNMNVNSNVLVAECEHGNGLGINNANITLIDVYNPAYRKGGNLKYKVLFKNSKSLSANLIKSNNLNKYWNRKNMSGVVFKTMAVLVNKYEGELEEYILKEKNYRIDSRTKYHSILMNHCKEIYNFSLNVSLTNSWGFKLANGSFDGMTGALQRRQVDFGGSVLFLKDDRVSVISHGRSTWLLRTVFIFRNTNKRSFREIFIYPLDCLVWFSVIFCAVLIITILKAAISTEKRILISNDKFKDEDSNVNVIETSWSILFIFTLGAFCQQGTSYSPQLISGKFAALSLFVFCVLFYQYYSGSMVSFLLTKQPSKIKNAEDLWKSPLKVAIQDIVYIRAYFKETVDPVSKKLYDTKIVNKNSKNNNFLSPERGLKLVQEKEVAFYIETSTGYPIIEDTFTDRTICELEEVVMVPPQTCHIATVKGSPFLDLLNYCMQYLTEVGITNRQRKIWDARKPNCIRASAATISTVDFSQIYPVSALLLLGILSSIVILIIEIIYYKFTN